MHVWHVSPPMGYDPHKMEIHPNAPEGPAGYAMHMGNGFSTCHLSLSSQPLTGFHFRSKGTAFRVVFLVTPPIS